MVNTVLSYYGWRLGTKGILIIIGALGTVPRVSRYVDKSLVFHMTMALSKRHQSYEGYIFRENTKSLKSLIWCCLMNTVKRTGDPDTNNRNILQGYKNWICRWKMCIAHNEEWEANRYWLRMNLLIMVTLVLVNQESIRTLGEKENYKYLGILDADIIKQRQTKKWKKNSSEERENVSKPSSATEISSNGLAPGKCSL